MNRYEPKSVRFPVGVQKSFSDCSSFPRIDFSAFEFPVKIIESPMDTRMENEILSAIKRVGVIVDKEELLRVLNYERDQYAKGYHAGYEAARQNQPKWISVEERLPEESVTVLVYRDGCCGVARLLDVEPITMWTYTGFGGDPTHWMPLPEPPKEEK